MKGALNYKVYLNKVDREYCSNSILRLLNGAKNYCRYNEVNGSIFFDAASRTIYFIARGVLVDKYSLPEKYKLNNVDLGRGKYTIDIDTKGFTSDACTISYLDRKGEQHKISICVGTGYAEIK
jgi:hypothetical protein